MILRYYSFWGMYGVNESTHIFMDKDFRLNTIKMVIDTLLSIRNFYFLYAYAEEGGDG